MPTSRKVSLGREPDETVPRRVRHITSIHIANFTPFPVRDEFTSALSRPSEQPQYAEHGHLSDDFDLTLGRKRGRRRSSTILSNASSSTVKGSPRESSSIAETTPRRRAASKPGLPSSKVRSSGPGPPTTRPLQRHRTISASSSNSHSTIVEASMSLSGSSASLNGILRDTSQPALEKILSSRLVETFVTITVPPEDDDPPSADNHAGLTRGTRRNTVSTGSSGVFARPRRGTSSSIPVTLPSSKGSVSHEKSLSVVSPTTNRQYPTRPSSPKPFSQRALRPSKSPQVPMASSSRPPTSERVAHNTEPPTPDYLSPIHRPSVNPGFYIDASSDFASGTNLSGCKMVVEIWIEEPSRSTVKGKAKERPHGDMEENHTESDWRVLETWDVDLNELIPFPNKGSIETSYMPPNTLCIALDPPGQIFFLPQGRVSHEEISRSRSPSPAAGYNSDPEFNARSIRPSTVLPPIQVPSHPEDDFLVNDIALEDSVRYPTRKGRLKSASWQEILKLVTLQAVIRDTEHSLSDIVREVESCVVHNKLNISLRESSECEARLHEIRAQKTAVNEESSSLRIRLAAKSEGLRKRREALQSAREAHTRDCSEDEARATEIDVERECYTTLQDRLPLIRNSLFNDLAYIYPIELISPPDLLFTILDVPLPIPIGPTDPAPPLSLPSHKEIDEDTVATALGYSAQVVQLLSAYLGQGLIYPVTCVGSRSLIKDGISRMVGPRMFPLFSKGVDTYRFEYGVFLLNKDIELLMTERNLRALDVRHTLPNLKNLLLTLTNPDIVEFCPHRPLSIASTTISALQSPVLAPSTSPDGIVLDTLDTATIRGASTTVADSPPPSGSATPTKSAAETPTPTNTIKKPRGFLDLSGFFRGRQPSVTISNAKAESSSMAEHHETTNTTVPVANGDASQSQDEGYAEGDDEDDRRTIRASVSEEVADRKLNGAHANGHLNGNGTVISHSHPQIAAEKAGNGLHASQIVDGVS